MARRDPRTPGSSRATAAAILQALLLGACATHSGRYYADDGPPEHAPADLASVPDAVPRIEPVSANANRPYSAFGRSYTPDTSDGPFEQRGMASWYGRRYHGSRTSSGEIYDMFAMSAAHPTLPIPSYARVTNARDGRSVIVRINDRGPFIENRIIDLSYAAAVRLGIAGPGSGEVVVHRITAREIAAGLAVPAPPPVAAAASPPAPAAALASSVPALPAPAPLSTAASVAAAAAPVAAAAAVAVDPLVALTTSDSATRSPAAAPLDDKDPEGAARSAAAAPPPSAPAPSAVSAGAPAQRATAQDPTARAASWSVQLGAFSIEANALALRDAIAAQLAAAGTDALPALARAVRIEQTGRLKRVLVGPNSDRDAAQALAQRLERLLARETSLYRSLAK